jgi:hypothetical protein
MLQIQGQMLKKQPLLIRRWRYRINRLNRNLLLAICGPTGSGKSYCGLTVAKMICSRFNVATHVVFTIEQFMELLQSGKLRRGDVILWDEAGVGIPSREWYSISNKAINYVLQTFRHLNLCVIFTMPSFDYIDKQTRLLFHAYIETIRIDYETKHVVVKVFECTYSPRDGKDYKKYYWLGGVKYIRFRIGKPSKDMIDVYEKLKMEFSQNLRENVKKDVSEVNDKLAARRLTDEEIQAQLKEMTERPTLAEVQRMLRIGKDRAYYNVNMVFGPAKRGRRPVNATPVA